MSPIQEEESRELPGRFATTRWTMVLKARSQRGEVSNLDLSDLCRIYYFPIYAYIRKQCGSPELALDLTQGFFTLLLEGPMLDSVDPCRGQFRAFLLASARNFISNMRDRDLASKRGGNVRHVSLDAAALEQKFVTQVSVHWTPEREFDRQWAVTVLDEVLRRLELEQTAAGRQHQFEVLRTALSSDRNAIDYDSAAQALDVTADNARTLVHRLRKRYRCLLRDVICETTTSPDDVESEIHDLFEALRSDPK
ncbi:MAG: sigma-70 family RNA polymerase sigma factor [Planctomyces sp.]|nr:sigma-70 family RNA polymerase sigma factor [Planctomyces sp.]